VDGFLRSMVDQLCRKASVFPDIVQKLYDEHEGKKKRQPSLSSLSEVFLSLLEQSQPLYLIIDALDECSTSRSPDREAMLRLINEIKLRDLYTVRVLILSRKERDIEDALQNVVTEAVCIQDEAIDADIRIHVHHLLDNDSRLSKWAPVVKKEIEESLLQGAHGM